MDKLATELGASMQKRILRLQSKLSFRNEFHYNSSNLLVSKIKGDSEMKIIK